MSEFMDYFGRPARPRVRLGDEPGASSTAYDDQFRAEIADQVFASVGDNATAHFDDMHITLWPEERMDAVGQNGNSGEHYDAVEHPEHYQSDSGIECIDAIRAALGDEAFVDHCRATAIKYCWRSGKKTNHAEDLRKAAWYLSEAAEVLEK